MNINIKLVKTRSHSKEHSKHSHSSKRKSIEVIIIIVSHIFSRKENRKKLNRNDIKNANPPLHPPPLRHHPLHPPLILPLHLLYLLHLLKENHRQYINNHQKDKCKCQEVEMRNRKESMEIKGNHSSRKRENGRIRNLVRCNFRRLLFSFNF